MNSEQKRISFNTLVAGYLNAALADGDGENDHKFTWLHLSGEALAVAHANCESFWNSCIIQGIRFDHHRDDFSRIGNDFWLTRNFAGAGFWDGDYPTNGELLTDIAQSFGETYIYLGDDDKLYIG